MSDLYFIAVCFQCGFQKPGCCILSVLCFARDSDNFHGISLLFMCCVLAETIDGLPYIDGAVRRSPYMFLAIIDFPYFAVCRDNRLVRVINLVLTYDSNRTLPNRCEVIYHSFNGKPLPVRDSGATVLNFKDYVFAIAQLNQPVDVGRVDTTLKLQAFEVDKLAHLFRVSYFAFHSITLCAASYRRTFSLCRSPYTHTLA